MILIKITAHQPLILTIFTNSAKEYTCLESREIIYVSLSMNKVIVIGSPGSGKSTFARKLANKTGLPLYYLDMIWHKPDRTTITRQEFNTRLEEIMKTDKWIIDGNYQRSIPCRLEKCDTVFFLDMPLETCMAGAIARLGAEREDMPWHDKELNPEFRQWVIDFHTQKAPVIRLWLESYKTKVEVVFFHTREE